MLTSFSTYIYKLAAIFTDLLNFRDVCVKKAYEKGKCFSSGMPSMLSLDLPFSQKLGKEKLLFLHLPKFTTHIASSSVAWAIMGIRVLKINVFKI